MARYRTVLRYPQDGKIINLFPETLTLTEEINKSPTVSMRLPWKEVEQIAEKYNTDILSVFTASLREIYIERRNADGNYVRIFYGVVSSFEVNPDKDGHIPIDLQAVGFFELFKKATIGVPFTFYPNNDAGTMAWLQIEAWQASNPPYTSRGITQGTIQTTKNRQRTIKFDSLYDFIYKMSNNNLKDGFDFEIDTNKQFQVWAKRGISRPNVVFTERHIERYKKPILLDLTNHVHVIGQSENEEDVLYVTRTSANSFKDDFGQLDEVLSERDVQEVATLNDKGDQRIEERRTPIPEFSLKHEDDDRDIGFFSYDLGDTVRVNVPMLNIVNESKRVWKRTTNLSESGAFISTWVT